MKFRIDAGTDIAMIGAWDVTRNEGLPPNAPHIKAEALEQDAAAGDLFLIQLGGDAGGPVDIYVDSPIPSEALADMRPAVGDFLLRLPSGRLTVGGVEDYRSNHRHITGPNSTVTLPAGDYRLRCYLRTAEPISPASASRDLKAALGPDDYAYYHRRLKLHLLGYLTLLLFPVLKPRVGWLLALLVTLAVLLLYFSVQAKLEKRNVRFQRILQQVNAVYRRAHEQESPWFIFELHRITQPTTLKGGTVRLSEELAQPR